MLHPEYPLGAPQPHILCSYLFIISAIFFLQFAMDRPASDLTELFTIGLSVSVKIIEIDEEKGRFLCSTRMCDCFNDNMDIGIEMLQTYLGERSRYLNSVVDCKGRQNLYIFL